MQAALLTFLFTDIEGSTRRWEADPAAMSAALAHHDEILRAAVTEAGGTVFKHTGDGICAVFPSAAAGLTGALTAQQRLAAEPLRVRMALHSGSAEKRGGDFFGPTLNRVARLMAAGWGGQILVSAAAAELAGDALPSGAELVDLGLHRLADLRGSERIFQLSRPGLDTNFPPLRTLSAHRHNLPVSLSSFVGRERELGDVSGLLKISRLVTVTGVGGAGKTRLAVEAASRAVDNFPDGVFFAELAPITDPGLVPAAVAGALGLLLDRPEPLSDQLAGFLERRATLIVLDNCEHVIEGAARLVQRLLCVAPEVGVLATSREPLRVPGETVWRIPPLERGDALELLCDRARTADVSFSPSETDLPALDRICARLDGIPLALELAAARLHLLSPAEVATRLDDRLRLLTGGARTAVDRHRTLRATIDWGYDLLDEASRSLLRRLSVFVGGLDLRAAEAVGSTLDGTDVLELVSGLVDRSWLAVEPPGAGPTRYRLIETIRQYAAEKLAEAGEAAEARHAHCRHFRRLAEERDDPLGSDAAWLRCARLEEDNLRAALEWSAEQSDRDSCLELATALLGYLAFTGRGAEGQASVERALAIEPRDMSRRTLIAIWLLSAYWPNFEPDSYENQLRTLLETVDSAGELGFAANVRAFIGLQRALRDPGRAAELLQGADLVASQPDQGPIYSAWMAVNRGWVYLAASDRESAERWFSRALDDARSARHDVIVVHAAAALATVTAARGESQSALALADEAIAGARVLELPLVLVMALTRAAEVEVLLGRPARATQHLTESLQILRDVGSLGWVAESLELAAVVAADQDAYADAARFLGAAATVDALMRDAARNPAPGVDLAASQACRALGEEPFAAERAAGAALTTDEALSAAIVLLLDPGDSSRAA